MIDGHYKIIAFGDDDQFKLFDLERDPREQHDISGKEKELFLRMKKLYEQLSSELEDICPEIRKLRGKKKDKPC